MNKKVLTMILTASLALCIFSGCCLSHDWQSASCETPKTCTKCDKTDGEALGHSWQEATCDTAKTCSDCGKVEGEALGHQAFWVKDDKTTMSGTCSGCGQEMQEDLDWEKLAPCHLQGNWESYDAPAGVGMVINGDGTAVFTREQDVLNMTWEFVSVEKGLMGITVNYHFTGEDGTEFDAVILDMLDYALMFPQENVLWSLSKQST